MSQQICVFQELREQVEKLEAELEEYKKGVTALTPFRGRTQSWKGILTIRIVQITFVIGGMEPDQLNEVFLYFL